MTKKHEELAQQILDHVGGKSNVANVMHCYTRLRVNCKDESLVQVEAIKTIDGVIGLQKIGQQYQFVIGNEVKEVYEAFLRLSGAKREATVDEHIENDAVKKKKLSIKSVFDSIIDGIVGSVVPLLPMLIASGLLKAFVLVGQQLGWIAADSPTAVTLSFVADAAFYFLPVIIGCSAAKKFGVSIALGGMMGAALIHPTFVSLVNEGASLSVFGLPVYAAAIPAQSYRSSCLSG